MSSSIHFHQRLQDLGVPSDLHVLAGLDHDFDTAPSMMTTTAATTASFLERFVTRRAEADDEARQFTFPAAQLQ